MLGAASGAVLVPAWARLRGGVTKDRKLVQEEQRDQALKAGRCLFRGDFPKGVLKIDLQSIMQ